jgi:predicted nucleotidyltransferase
MMKEELILTLKAFFKERAHFFGVEMAFLYGSWARGYHREDSDVDIALVFSQPSSEEERFRFLTDISFEASIKTGKEVNIISIDEDFKRPVLYSF